MLVELTTIEDLTPWDPACFVLAADRLCGGVLRLLAAIDIIPRSMANPTSSGHNRVIVARAFISKFCTSFPFAPSSKIIHVENLEAVHSS